MEDTYREGSCTPRGSSTDLVKTGKDRVRGLVSQRHIDHPVMRKRAHGRNRRALLPSTLGRGRDKHPGVFAPVSAGLPLLAGAIPEGFPLGWEVAVASWDAEKEGVVFGEFFRGDFGDGAVFWGRVHLREDVGGKGFGDSEWVEGLVGEIWLVVEKL